ncbi:MAG TPA: response regulator [Planctomycetota bacterium]
MARIVVIEDNADLGEIYRLSLEAAGHQILGVFDQPDVALESSDPGAPADLVILDERLGSRSGSSYVEPFRRVWPAALFLLVSADPDAVEAAHRRGFDEAKRKPVSLSHMVENIHGLLSRSR